MFPVWDQHLPQPPLGHGANQQSSAPPLSHLKVVVRKSVSWGKTGALTVTPQQLPPRKDCAEACLWAAWWSLPTVLY